MQDLSGTGHLKYTEFLAATIESTDLVTEERLAEAFDRLDADDSGYISVKVNSSSVDAVISTVVYKEYYSHLCLFNL